VIENPCLVVRQLINGIDLSQKGYPQSLDRHSIPVIGWSGRILRRSPAAAIDEVIP
jgi:hypothetical protein